MSPLVLERTRGILHAAGRDPVKMVHDMLTSDVRGLGPDRAAYGLFLTPKGRVIADVRVVPQRPENDGPLWIETDASAVEPLAGHLRKYVPPLFATFEDVSDRWMVVGVYGDGASAAARLVVDELHGSKDAGGGLDSDAESGVAPRTDEAGADAVVSDAPEERVVRFESGFALHTLLTGDDGWDFFVPVADGPRVVELLLEAGGRPGAPAALDALRVAAGRPRYGRELTEDVIPLEAGLLDRAIDQEKGCYTGQEVIVRILHRGHVNRHLRRLEFRGAAPEPGAELFEPGVEKPRGVVTSVAENEAGALGLGYVRREIEPPAELRVGSRDGEPVLVTALDD